MEKHSMLKRQGNRALQLGDYATAIRNYSDALAYDACDYILFSNRSAAFAKAGLYEDALSDAETVIELKPDWVKGYSRKGSALAFLGHWDESIATFKDGISRDPANEHLIEGLTEVERVRAKSKKFPNPFHMPEALGILRVHPHTREFMKDPEFAKLVTKLSRTPTTLGQQMTDRRVQTALWVLLGLNLKDGDKFEVINMRVMRRSTSAGPPTPSYTTTTDESMDEDLRKAQLANSTLKRQGNRALALVDYAPDIQKYSYALAYVPSTYLLFSNRSLAFAKAGLYEGALSDAEKVIKLKPDWGKGYSRKGIALALLGRFDEAIATFNDGISRDPANEHLIEGLEEVERVRAKSKKVPNPFQMPDAVVKLRAHHHTREFMEDPEFAKLVIELSRTPTTLGQQMTDTRVLAALGVLLGSNLTDGDKYDVIHLGIMKPSTIANPPTPSDTTTTYKSMDEAFSKAQLASSTLKGQGNSALQPVDHSIAIYNYSDALTYVVCKHILLSNRSAAFAKAGLYKHALSDAEKVIELKPNWGKGYSRKGIALAFLGCFNESIATFKDGISRDPDNGYLIKGLKEVERVKAKSKNFPNSFQMPRAVTKLRAHPHTRAFMKDPEFAKLVTELSRTPTTLGQQMTDTRVLAAHAVLLGLNLKDGHKYDVVNLRVTTPSTSADPPTPSHTRTTDESMDEDLSKAQLASSTLKRQRTRALQPIGISNIIRNYSYALTYDACNYLLLANRSAAFAKAGLYEDALSDAEKVIKLKPDWGKGYSRKSSALAFLGRFDEAIATFKDGICRDPDYKHLIRGLKQVERVKAKSKKVPNPFQMPRAVTKLRAHPHTRAFMKDPEFAKLVTKLSRTPTTLGQPVTDERVLAAHGVLLGLNLKDGHKYDVVTLRFTRESKSAKPPTPADTTTTDESLDEDLSKAQLANLNAAKSCYKIPVSEYRTPAIRAILSDITNEIKEDVKLGYIDHDKAEESKEMGNRLFDTGNYTDALEHYIKAIKLYPDNPEYYIYRAACYMKLGAFDLGLRDCDKCLALEPKFIKGLLTKGKILLGMEQAHDALRAYLKALGVDRNNAEALEGYKTSAMKMNANPEEVRKRAMAEPEIQAIMHDPAMRLILEQMKTDPSTLKDHCKNPAIAAKIETLLEWGLVALQ